MGEIDAPVRAPGGHQPSRGPRCIALVGPFQTGKTTVLEAILARMGVMQRQGSVAAGTSVGDASEEARSHRMGVELNAASVMFLGDLYTIIDCPGSIEFLSEMDPVLPVVDAAIVVCDADDKKIPELRLILRALEQLAIPRLIFLNKIDGTDRPIGEIVTALQRASTVPLLLRQIPIRESGATVGYIDLALERAFRYQDHTASRVVDIPTDALDDEKGARYALLERLSEHDDRLLEELLEDVEPTRDHVFDDLAHEMQDGIAVPVLIGSALNGNGIGRLMKAVRHEVPGVDRVLGRLGVDASGEPLAQVIKTLHTAHAGKLSLARVLRGGLKDGTTLMTSSGHAARFSGLVRLMGQAMHKIGEATAGEVVGLGRHEPAQTGHKLSVGKPPAGPDAHAPSRAVMAVAVQAREHKDDVKLGTSLRKLIEEDGSLSLEQDPDCGDLILRGRGEMHLRVAIERLSSKFGIAAVTHRPHVAYRETIRKAVSGIRGRHKKQSGGHGQFGDVVIDIAPLPRGTGIVFDERIVGGVVPRQYFSSIEEGARAALMKGPMGFPVVDVHVTLTDGSYHSVDSSDMAFQQAARLALVEALPRGAPVLLEPVLSVEIAVPSEATAKVNLIVSSRRGQILGFDAREGWDGWDLVQAAIPEAEMVDLVVDLRSVTAGVGTFQATFDHLAEVIGRDADQAIHLQQEASRARAGERIAKPS